MANSSRKLGSLSNVVRGALLIGVLIAVLAGVLALIFGVGLLRIVASDSDSNGAAAPAVGRASDPSPDRGIFASTRPASTQAAAAVAPPPPVIPPVQKPSASLIGVDDSSKGGWVGRYGKAGYYVAMNGSPAHLPPGVDLGVRGKRYIWEAQTTDPRALSIPDTPSRQSAGQWFDWTQFTVDLDLRGSGKGYQVALYLLDWDNNNRAQRLEVTDADSGAVLLSRTDDHFEKGRYVLLRLSGHVILRFTRTGGSNCTLSGIFLDDLKAAQ